MLTGISRKPFLAMPASQSNLSFLAFPKTVIVFAILTVNVYSSPIPFDFKEWLQGQLQPAPGKSTEGEIQCYTLPFGILGFISHVLTYWSVACLYFGKKPLKPWGVNSALKAGKWDVFLGIVSLIGSVVPAAFTISACRNRWQFILLGVWKLLLSVTANAAALHQAIGIFKRGLPYEEFEPAWTLGIYSGGIVVGLTGLLSLVSEAIADNAKLKIITYVFGGSVGLPLVVGIFSFTYWICACGRATKDGGKLAKSSFKIAAGLFGILAALYSDWALAAMTGNWIGTPSEDKQGLYWTYFGAKRLLILFF
jgi:hypothetical protein